MPPPELPHFHGFQSFFEYLCISHHEPSPLSHLNVYPHSRSIYLTQPTAVCTSLLWVSISLVWIRPSCLYLFAVCLHCTVLVQGS